MKPSKFLSVRQAIHAQILNQHAPQNALTSAQGEAQEEMRNAFNCGDGLIVPFGDRESRAMTASGTTSTTLDQGGMSIATEVPEIGPALRSALRLPGLGARMLTGLTDKVDLPRGVGSISSEWLAENANASDVSETLAVLSLRPRRVVASVPVSKQLILQGGPAFELWLNTELIALLGVEIERVVINGLGASNQPAGILGTSGIGSVAGGANGLAPTLANLCDLEYAVTGTGKADRGPTGWILSPMVRRKLRQTFANGTGSGSLWPLDSADRLLGHQAGVTTACPDNLTKGSSAGICSGIIFGSFSELFIALWGAGIAVEVTTNRTLSIAGKVQVTASCYVDCGVRTPAAFAAMLDALCA